MTKFTKGQAVKFLRNSVTKSDATTVSAVVTMPENSPSELEQSYIIEYQNGWTPNSLRIKSFELDATKKYLFVSEKELTVI
jgi:hypothetical protein